MRRWLATLATALLLAAPAPAAAPAAAQPREARLVIGLALGPSTLDPHGYAASSDTTVNGNIYESLVRIAPDGRLEPGLALSWTVSDGLVWDLALRPGVVFHDGTPFTSADVLATFARIPELKTALRGLASKLAPIAAVEARGPHAVRLRTHEPTPGLLDELNKVMILRAASATATDPAVFNSGREAIGTGPFRFAAYAPDSRLDLVRNPAWWDQAPPWEGVTLRFIPRDSVRAAALAGRPGITLSRAAGLNTVYVMLATAREEAGPFISLPDGAAPAANPLRDRRVRAALSLALNRAGLAERLLAGAGLPASQFAAIGSREHMDHVTLPAQDLARARALLAEAGYPDGLQIVLHGPSDRFSNIAQVAEAVAQMWARAGVATTVETMPWNIMARRAVRGEFAATVFACCSSTADTLTTTRDLLATQDPARSLGVSNWGRYSNPVLDRVVAAGMVQFDPAERGRAAAQAASIVAEDVPLIPLYHPLNTWAARAPLSFVPRQDGQTPAIGVRRGS